MSDTLLIPRDALGSGRVPVTLVTDASALAQHFADMILGEYRNAKQRGRETVVMIVPVRPVGQFDLLAARCNKEQVSIANLLLIGMDEYLGSTDDWIAEDDPLSFRGHMQRRFWSVLDPALAPPPEHRVFPHPARLDEVQRLIEHHGGVDVCFGGVGITGHLAYNEPDATAEEAEFAASATRVVTLAPESRIINAIASWGGAVARIPPRAVTIGMREMLGARKLRLFFNRAWQRAVLRDTLFGPVTPACPASFIQRHPDPAVIVSEEAARVPVQGLA